MKAHRFILGVPFFLALGACKPAPPGATTNPPGEGGDGLGGGSAPPAADGGDAKGGGEPAKAEEPKPVAKSCPAQVSDTPSALFNEQLLIRLPLNVQLVEDNPAFARTFSDFVSTCDAMVDEMWIVIYEDDAKKSAAQFRQEQTASLEKQGWPNPKITPESEKPGDDRVIIEYAATDKSPAAKVYLATIKRHGKVFILWYRTQPDHWPGLYETFKESANRLIVVPQKDSPGKKKK